jgi:hypothetical protein
MLSPEATVPVAVKGGVPLTFGRCSPIPHPEKSMSWLGVLLATIGASLILGALTFVSALIGALITAMIVLMCGPLIDRVIARRNRGSV